MKRKYFLKTLVYMVCISCIFVSLFIPMKSFAQNETESIVKIHMIANDTSCNAFIVESNGHFAVVDSGEDDSIPRNKVNVSGVTRSGHGVEDLVINYMRELGVNADNFDYYIGTHAHSDHIGSGDEVIDAIPVKTIITPEYKDEYITNKKRLWDNLEVYNDLIAAGERCKAKIITKPADFDGDIHSIKLGDTDLVLYNYRASEKGPYNDANSMSLGVKVIAPNGKTAFIGGDLDDFIKHETVLADQIGKVDIATMNHHGYEGSNSYHYVKTLDASIILCPNRQIYTTIEMDFGDNDISHNSYNSFVDRLNDGSRIFSAGAAYKQGKKSIIASLDENLTVNVDMDYKESLYGFLKGYSVYTKVDLLNGKANEPLKHYNGQWHLNDKGKWYAYNTVENYSPNSIYPHNCVEVIDGLQYIFKDDGYLASGWWKNPEGKYYFANSDGTITIGWLKNKGVWYYLNDNGVMQTGWLKTGGKWYYLNGSGVMQTGWLKTGGKWYYLNGSGVMQTGWLKTGGKWYYLNGSGAMQTGWLKTGGKWYYLNSSGAMQTGWLKIGGKWYKFNSSGAWIE
ncbi:MAG: MBL fold metallo-hydrolase [Eubacteriales bacterium]|nr:MBL fold metallo-hydrolase [Eubacteriales bacterium]MDY3332770.1 MBL fold metallo-hydrolase [Gallibacter sp.]